MKPKTIQLWDTKPAAVVPAKAKTDRAIAECARQLSVRDKKQIVSAAQRGEYEMGATFLWQKAMTALKKQLESLGVEFLGEMLEREFIAGTPAVNVITDHDALRLAEELGMFNATEAMHLRQSLELLTHLTSHPLAEQEEDSQGEMNPEDFTKVLRACVRAVLGHERMDGAVAFSKFRDGLEQNVFQASDGQIVSLLASPYFLKRTTLRVLVALVKTASGASLDNGVGNLQVLLPLLWAELMRPERDLVGRAYAEVHNAGNKPATQGIGLALHSVRGFDYVPESLRSRTFVQFANLLKTTHFGFNNFYNEPAPMAQLASLGTSIPTNAIADCVSAVLCVKLGNRYGTCWGAQTDADALLRSLSKDRWRVYLEECLPADDAILSKIEEGGVTTARWLAVFKEHSLNEIVPRASRTRDLLLASATGPAAAAALAAATLNLNLRNRAS